jgi:hypothetical protein
VVDLIGQLMTEPYWKLVIPFLIGIVYILFHNRCVVVAAKKRAHIVILAAEKNASTLFQSNEKQMMDWIMQRGYSGLPVVLRMFVSKLTFNAIILDVYRTATEYAENHQSQLPSGQVSSVRPTDHPNSLATATLPEARWPSIQSQ